MSEMKHLTAHHRGYEIIISYWIKERRERKVVSYDVKNREYAGMKTLKGGHVKEPIGGKSGLFGVGARPERSFHEMIAEAVEEAARWINQNDEHLEVPDPDEVTETLAIRGWDSEDKQVWEL